MYARYPVRLEVAGHTHLIRTATPRPSVLAITSPLGYYGTDEFPKRDLGERVRVVDLSGAEAHLTEHD